MVFAAVFALLISSAPDRWGPAEPAVYVSDGRRTALEVVPSYNHQTLQVRGTVVKLQDDGSCKVIWSKQLRNMPLFALVSNSGRVATFDEHGRAGAEHALVIYGVDGALVKDWSLKELLTGDEYYNIPASVSSKWWWKPAPPNDVPRIEPANQGSPFRLVIPTTNYAQDAQPLTIEVDLATGKRIK